MRTALESRDGTTRPAALFDSVVVSTKWPMRWLLRNCRPGDTIPQTFDDAAYVAAHELSEAGQNYSHFEAAFTYASLGVLTLTLEDQSIRASDEFRRGVRYDAYRPSAPTGDDQHVARRYDKVLTRSVRRSALRSSGSSTTPGRE